MDQTVREAIYRSVGKESFARKLNMKLVELEDRYSAVEMTYDPQTMGNIYDRAHGGVIFSLIDEAFETVGQADGTVGVAMNVSVTYVSSPDKETVLRAEAKEISRTRKTVGYTIVVKDQEKNLIATCQALLYRTGKKIPFL